MKNFKHDFIKYNKDKVYDSLCTKCNQSLWLLYDKSCIDYDHSFLNELHVDFINRTNPCITDEEALIKKALE